MSNEAIRVDFYVVPGTEASARLRFACRLTEKAYGLKHRVHLHTASAAEAERLDELLWTYRQGSFIPHDLMASTPDDSSPVTIGDGEHQDPAGDLLINLGDTIPAFFDQFARVAEIIDGTEDCRRLGRERYGVYRDNGYQPNTHQIS